MPSAPADIVAIGDNISDCYVELGLMFPGGNAVNVAVAVARSGRSAAYVGAVGDDARGHLLRESLQAEGVDVERLVVRPGVTAYTYVSLVDGDRAFTTVERGVALLHPTPEDLAYASRSLLAHTTYCSGLEEAVPLLGRATKLSFDFDTHLADDYAAQLVPHVWVAEFSASALDVAECESLLRWAHSHGPPYVLATRADKGAMMFDGETITVVPAQPDDPVDTLGAGDAFIGRALHGLLAGEPPDAIVAASTMAAAQACQSLGGFGHGVPIPEEPFEGSAQAEGSRRPVTP